MGRPPLRRDAKVKKRTVWIHDNQVDRVTALNGPLGLSQFIRKAVDALLEAEEAQAAAAVSPREQTWEEKIEGLFGDD